MLIFRLSMDSKREVLYPKIYLYNQSNILLNENQRFFSHLQVFPPSCRCIILLEKKKECVCVCGTDWLVCGVTAVFLCLGLCAMSDVWPWMPDHHRPLVDSDRWGTGWYCAVHRPFSLSSFSRLCFISFFPSDRSGFCSERWQRAFKSLQQHVSNSLTTDLRCVLAG